MITITVDSYMEVLHYVKKSLCAAYEEAGFVYGIHSDELCVHPWCHGALDVLNRVNAQFIRETRVK